MLTTGIYKRSKVLTGRGIDMFRYGELVFNENSPRKGPKASFRLPGGLLVISLNGFRAGQILFRTYVSK
jgi:hypothetical protein